MHIRHIYIYIQICVEIFIYIYIGIYIYTYIYNHIRIDTYIYVPTYITLRYITLHLHVRLHFISLHDIALHCIALHTHTHNNDHDRTPLQCGGRLLRASQPHFGCLPTLLLRLALMLLNTDTNFDMRYRTLTVAHMGPHQDKKCLSRRPAGQCSGIQERILPKSQLMFLTRKTYISRSKVPGRAGRQRCCKMRGTRT